jgi:hypothetical protein
MDIAAITELKSRAIDAITSAEKYRDLAERHAGLRDFYQALAFTHERIAREANLMLDKAERLIPAISEAA